MSTPSKIWQKKWTIRQCWPTNVVHAGNDWSFSLDYDAATDEFELKSDDANIPVLLRDWIAANGRLMLRQEGKYVYPWKDPSKKLTPWDPSLKFAYRGAVEDHCDDFGALQKSDCIRLFKKLDEDHALYMLWVPDAVEAPREDATTDLLIVQIFDPSRQSGTGHGDPR